MPASLSDSRIYELSTLGRRGLTPYQLLASRKGVEGKTPAVNPRAYFRMQYVGKDEGSRNPPKPVLCDRCPAKLIMTQRREEGHANAAKNKIHPSPEWRQISGS
jgi:hypothetical protein